jgi:hypothetical protein
MEHALAAVLDAWGDESEHRICRPNLRKLGAVLEVASDRFRPRRYIPQEKHDEARKLGRPIRAGSFAELERQLGEEEMPVLFYRGPSFHIAAVAGAQYVLDDMRRAGNGDPIEAYALPTKWIIENGTN